MHRPQSPQRNPTARFTFYGDDLITVFYDYIWEKESVLHSGNNPLYCNILEIPLARPSKKDWLHLVVGSLLHE